MTSRDEGAVRNVRSTLAAQAMSDTLISLPLVLA